jgi:hypothetical protein
MKKKLLIAGACVLTISLVFLIIITIEKNYVDASSAKEISLKYHYYGKNIDVKITDEDDIRIIKENLKGVSYKDFPSCGFSLDISIIFFDGEKSLIFCPACDGCSIARIGDSNKYVNIKNREALETVLKKYEFSFPCI